MMAAYDQQVDQATSHRNKGKTCGKPPLFLLYHL
jgi:hypothetical protein